MGNIPAPTNALVRAIKKAFDLVIEGFGVELAFAAAVAELPILGAPIIRVFVKIAIEQSAQYVNENGKRMASIFVIRYQNDVRKDEYDKAIEPIKKGKPTPEQIQAARDAADRIINRNR